MSDLNGYPVRLSFSSTLGVSSAPLIIYDPGSQTPRTLAAYEQVSIMSLTSDFQVSDQGNHQFAIVSGSGITYSAITASTLLLAFYENVSYHDDATGGITAPAGQVPCVVLSTTSSTATLNVSGTALITSTTSLTTYPSYLAKLSNNPNATT